jgi:hypothetical protein
MKNGFKQLNYRIMYTKTTITIKSVAKPLLCAAMVAFMFARVSAQEAETSLKNLVKIDLAFTGIGVSCELPLSQKTLLKCEAGLGGGYEIYSDRYRYLWDITAPSAYFNLHGKYYYNRAARLEKGKTLQFNSGNFLGFHAKYVTPSLWIDNNYNYNALLAGFHWGFQYKIGKHWSYEFYIGPGIAFDMSETATPFLDTNIKFSYILPI